MSAKLFLITRGDLSPGQQAVQAAHALQEYNVLFPERAKSWHSGSNTLVLLQVLDEEALFVLATKMSHLEIATFREPDRSQELTAIAVGPEAARLVKRLPLALT